MVSSLLLSSNGAIFARISGESPDFPEMVFFWRAPNFFMVVNRKTQSNTTIQGVP